MDRILKFFSLLKKIYQKSDRFLYLLVGIPSYDKYKEYMSKYRPNEPLKTQGSFLKKLWIINMVLRAILSVVKKDAISLSIPNHSCTWGVCVILSISAMACIMPYRFKTTLLLAFVRSNSASKKLLVLSILAL